MVAYFQARFSFLIRLYDTRFVFRLRVLAYDSGKIQRQRINMPVKELTVLLMQCLHARVHIHIILRHTGGQQTTVAIQDVSASSSDRTMRRHLLFRYFQPCFPLESLNIDDTTQYGSKTDKDCDEDNRKSPNRISLFVVHHFSILTGGTLFSCSELPFCCRASNT